MVFDSRRAMIIHLFLLLALPHVGAAETFRIATYNVENYLEQTSGTRPAKPEPAKAKVCEGILALKPDVLALQEMGSTNNATGIQMFNGQFSIDAANTTIEGKLTTPNTTGSLFGTASNAVTSSYLTDGASNQVMFGDGGIQLIDSGSDVISVAGGAIVMTVLAGTSLSISDGGLSYTDAFSNAMTADLDSFRIFNTDGGGQIKVGQNSVQMFDSFSSSDVIYMAQGGGISLQENNNVGIFLSTGAGISLNAPVTGSSFTDASSNGLFIDGLGHVAINATSGAMVTGSLTAPSITGSLFGTASNVLKSGLPYRAGQLTVSTNATSSNVLFSTSLPTASFAVSLLPDSSFTGSYFVKGKTVSGFTASLSQGVSGGITFDYQAWLNN